MKKTLTLFLFTCLFSIVQATEIHTVNTTAGNLATDASVYLATVTDLTVTGTIDARDFKTMRDDMPLLANLDLSDATIAEYTGIDGTVLKTNTTYPANEIPEGAFDGAAKLTSIMMPSSITSIGFAAFIYCPNLTGSLTIPSSVTSIGSYAFYACTGITGSLTIPSSVTSIGKQAFYDCTGLTGSVTIPSSVTSIGERAFQECKGLIIVDVANPNYLSEDGVLFDKNKTRLLQCPKSKTGSYTIPSSVTSIEPYAFHWCSGLTGSLTIPASVTSIGPVAFRWCSNISSIKVYKTTPSSIVLGYDVFDGIPTSTCVLHVPVGKQALYAAANQWSAFTTVSADLLVAPAVTTQAVSNISFTTATGKVDITDLGAPDPTTYGVCWKIGSTPTISDSEVHSETVSTVGEYAVSMTGLTKNTTYKLRAYATNTAGTSYGDEITFTTLAQNAPTDIALSASAIDENVAANSIVGTFSSTDPDGGNAFTYSLVSGDGSTDNASFNISGNNLQITNSPDYETKKSYSVRVRSTSNGALFYEKAFTITINNVNETPTDIALSASAIDENVAANSIVGTLSSTDPDDANTFTYSLVSGDGSTDNASFNISGNSLQITNSPDYETKNSYLVRVRTTDQGGLYFEKTFTITINNAPEAGSTIIVSSPIAGGLSAAIAAADATLSAVTNLTVTGTIDARDFKTMRDNMPLLATLTLSGVTIAEYTGTDGTGGTTNITYPANEIPQNAFCTTAYNGKTSLISVAMPTTTTSIGEGAFFSCSGLTVMNMPNNVTAIDENAFSYCSGLQSLTLSSSLVTIGGYAFRGLRSLAMLTIPPSVQTIGREAFSDNNTIVQINVPASVTSIGLSAFSPCSALITVDAANPNYSSVDGLLFNKDKTVLLSCPSSIVHYVISPSVTTIGDLAFFRSEKLLSVSIPSSVTTISNQAFSGSTNLNSIKMYGATPGSIALGSDIFFQIPTSTCILHVPVGTRDAYAAAPQWKDFMPNIIDDLVIAPAAITTVASAVTKTGAILNGSVNACGGSTAVTFEYGLTKSYGTTVTVAQSPVTGTLATAVSYALTGLTPNTTYHYRIVGVNSGGTTNGNDMTFTTIDIAPNISYVTPQSYVVGTPIVALTPTNTGGGVGLFTISPALPAGLSFDSATGTISGTPTAASAATTYTVSTANGGGSSTATISIAVKSPQTITFDALASKTYGDDTFDLAATSTSGLAVSYSSDNTAVARISGTTVIIVGAGTANITAAQAGDATNLAAANVTQQLTVSKKALTVTAVAETKTYDGTTASTAVPTVGALASDDAINVAPIQVFDNINAGTNTLTASGLTIKRVVRDNAPAFDKPSVETIYKGRNTGVDMTGNYDISYVSAAGTINKQALTVTAATDTKTYDGTTVSNVAPAVGVLVVGDEINAAPTQVFDNINAGTNALTASGLTVKKGSTDVTDNYDISYVAATGTINKLAITVTAATDTKIYDGTTDSKVTPTVGTLAVGDAIATAPTQAFDNAAVGTTHVLTASGLTIKKGSTDVTDNYDISYVTATGTINKLAVTVTAAIDTKIYDGTTVSTAVPTVGTLATGDAISTAPAQAFDNAAVGTTHVLTASGLILKKDDADVTGNYDISYVTANGSITAKALTIAAPTVTPSKVYDGNKMAAITSMGTLSGVATGDEGNVTVSAVASYDNATVGTNKMITVVYSLGGNAAGNYTAPADFVVRGAEISSGTITLGPLSNPTPSPTSNNLVLFYNVVAGGPTQYKITYETAALAVGIQNVSYTALATANSDGTITIIVPAGTKPGKYKGTLQMRNDSGAESTAYDFVMTVNIPTEYIVVKYKRILVLDNNTRMFASYQWYKDGVAIEGATKQFYRDPKGLIGTYTVQAITTDGETLYSFPKELNLPINQKVTAYPSMVKADQTFTVEISNEDTDQNLAGAELSVYSERGVLVYKTTHVEKINTIKLSTTQGVYTGRVRMADGDAYQFKVVVAN